MKKQENKQGICSPSEFGLKPEYQINFFCNKCLQNTPHIAWPKKINNMIIIAPALYFDRACMDCNNTHYNTVDIGKQQFVSIKTNHEILLEEFLDLINE